MKLSKGFFGVLVIAILAVFLVGCGADGPAVNDEMKVGAVLDKYEQAMKMKRAENLADLFIYPIYVDGAYFINRDEAVAGFSLGFALTTIKEFSFKDRAITVSGNEAVVEAFMVSKLETFGFPTEEERRIILQLKKVGGVWKIVDSD